MKSNISPAVKKQIAFINDKMEKLIDRIAKNNADNLKTLCEISVLLQNIETNSIDTNDKLIS
jgi:hypothetical protein